MIDIATLDPESTIVVATGNAHKLTEIEAILGESPALEDVRFVALGELGDFPDPEEDGVDFYENAVIKARAALDETGLLMAVADDSGLCVDALGGQPGIMSARWAGQHGNDEANNDKMLAEMADVPEDERTARFHSTVVLITRDEDGEEILRGDGDVEGTIAYDRKGTNGFGYDPLFKITELGGKRMAELEPEEKNATVRKRGYPQTARCGKGATPKPHGAEKGLPPTSQLHLQDGGLVRVVVQNLVSVLGDEAEVLDAHADIALKVDARLDGEDLARADRFVMAA